MDVEASKAWCAMCATEFDWETILEEMLGRIAPLEDEVRRLREENFTLIKESSCDKNVVIPDLERQIETVHESITRMIQEVGYRTPG